MPLRLARDVMASIRSAMRLLSRPLAATAGVPAMIPGGHQEGPGAVRPMDPERALRRDRGLRRAGRPIQHVEGLGWKAVHTDPGPHVTEVLVGWPDVGPLLMGDAVGPGHGVAVRTRHRHLFLSVEDRVP